MIRNGRVPCGSSGASLRPVANWCCPQSSITMPVRRRNTEKVARLCENIDADLLGLCLDTVTTYSAVSNPVEAVGLYGARIPHLHLKDVNFRS